MTQTAEFVHVTYLAHSKPGTDWQKKANGIAIGLTVGTWTELPAARKEAMQKHLGHVVSAEVVGTDANGLEQALLTIAYPTVNFTPDIPALLTSVFGKLSMDGMIRLVNIELPTEFSSRFPGPKFGIDGLRKQLNAYDRPLLMSIFKSVIGYDTETLAEQFYQQALGGVDLVKDDEIFFDETYAPFEKRIAACRIAAERAQAETGKFTLYAANLTGPVTEIFEKARRAVDAGASALLLNVLTYGYDVLQRLAEDSRINVPIMAHPALAGALYPSAQYGISAHVVLGQLMRIAGADIVLYPSAYGSVALERNETLKIAQALTEARGDVKRAFPVPSAGIHPGLVPYLYQDLGNDQIINAGGGVHGHPGGAAAGGRAFGAAIAGVLSGKTLSETAETSQELETALALWGNPSEK
ncbi:2,3-diketo-5-methylthiopentyl-1-phosphate enolase [Tumebacillus permanentifrigoris]|uniref:2,3-diketo-5-methylthiopentyl-1-phosphate enolase n=1 Tax=Tumebacillus permanentifrigoris TaxID=378543 RepID=A0A316D6P5_9BACL|nr:2,3-diketo-5-methylthiopentyl-1-phosphate enolase [Tumebacillus permanentifrigoris]PWK07448.1 2,3-diketo-5-methylthiopentyl-1-phosphate enolase [Tumebacillus permanentifrigoris]